MTIHQSLPFGIGQLAEAKSFKRGYRGAWFRCKIHGTMRRKGQIVYGLEYYDYPDEEIEWIEIYQKPPKSSSTMNELKKELILRPHYPKIYHVNELPDLNTISEVIVAVHGVWRVGDSVDWLSEGCFWSATVTETISNDKVKVIPLAVNTFNWKI
ncbi:hypothetical protein Cgig2_007738 [Carnegiea gigantea]|uniref:Agenet-like domain-containing protein n=1 Tax=Carnegiea gigantea TaxID=171969 RepID=A0A9Q1K8T6_9CARY|nr:hypothetical protein Cgig2_007738 [Carnegiea gigantea]